MTTMTVTVHSYKGGTGKSIVAVNLAHSLSFHGKSVLIDSDHLAPCLDAFFENYHGKGEGKESKSYLDFLEENASIKEVMVKTEYDNLWLIPAAPAEIGKDILSKDKNWHSRALQRLIKGLSELRKDFSHIIIDNQYGISLASTNNLAAADASILVLRPVSYGMEGTTHLMSAIYKKLKHLTVSGKERKDYLLWNQVPNGDIKTVKESLEIWNAKFRETGLLILPMICYHNDIALNMLLKRGSGIIFNEHPFKKTIYKVRDILLRDILEK